MMIVRSNDWSLRKIDDNEVTFVSTKGGRDFLLCRECKYIDVHNDICLYFTIQGGSRDISVSNASIRRHSAQSKDQLIRKALNGVTPVGERKPAI